MPGTQAKSRANGVTESSGQQKTKLKNKRLTTWLAREGQDSGKYKKVARKEKTSRRC
jgi:spore germination protein GerM